MKLSEIKGEKALEVIADLIDPFSEISKDRDLVNLIRNRNFTEAIKKGLKEHQKSILTMLAILNLENPETYEPRLLEVPKMLLDLFNDEELMSLFSSQVKMEKTSSSPVMENIEAQER